MARETKVGLLAGLGFIICFAIILANRGRVEPVTSHVSYVVDEGKDLQRIAQMPPKQDVGRAASGEFDRGESRRGAQNASPAAQSAPAGTDRRAVDGSGAGSMGSGADVPLSGGDGNVTPARSQYVRGDGAGSSANVSSLPGQSPIVPSSPLAAITRPTGGPSLTAESQEQVRRRRVLEEHLNGLRDRRLGSATPVRLDRRSAANASTSERTHGSQTPAGGQLEAISRPPVRSSATAAGPRAARHTVVAGDTLSRIAAEHYGRGSATFISAIFDANRHVLASRDLVPLGAELILPVIEGSGGSTGKAPPAAPESAQRNVNRRETAGGSQPSGFRWYQIKRSDRYASIAREQLGDQSRWQEIYELNKDKFPSPDRIRHGVRIKIPISRLADAGGVRR